jgi:uncharacterized protein with von Willebrand factor type A (vWA) domain
MFDSLPHIFRKQKLSADVRTLLLLRKAMDKGLVKTMGDLYVVLKGLITNDPKDFGPYTTAFYEYFLSIEIKKGEKLEQAVARSEAFRNWKKERYGEDDENAEMPDINELIDRYLDEVHLTTFDIKKMLSGKDILNKDDPDRRDDSEQDIKDGERKVTEGADYTDIPLEELLERMRKVAEQQKRRHEGGDHWIGQYGRSPYGQNGAAAGGIRTGGSGGGKMARRVIGDPQFYPVDTNAILKDDNIDAALASLKGIEDETAEVILDIPKTIKEGLKQGGIFLPYEKEKIQQKVQVILMIDNGGYSMHPYIKSVRKLFSKMKTRFAHDLKVYYFHNTIYGGAYSDLRRQKFVPIEKILSNDKNYSVFVIGDADMGPYELSEASMRNWGALKKRFKRMAWLNPLPGRYWAMSTTVNWLKQLVHMYPLTPDGIEKAVSEINRKRRYSKR